MIGTVASHGKDGFVFITARRIRTGEFVCYLDADIGKKILCRTVHTEPLREFPVEFLTDTDVNAFEAAEFYGFDAAEFTYSKVEAKVIGYFDEAIGEFMNPRTQPVSGTLIEEAGSVMGYVNRVKRGQAGSAYIGSVLGTDQEVVLSVKDVVGQHLSVIASTGAGKSYAVGVLVEELMMPYNRAPVLVFDPHSEYGTLGEMCNKKEFIAGDYRPKVKIVHPADIKIRISDLSVADFISVMDDGTMSDKMKLLFREAFNKLRKDKKLPFVRSELEKMINGLRSESNEPTIEGILWRFRKLQAGIFDDYRSIPLGDYFQVGQLTVLDVSGIEEGYQQLIASVMLRRLFEAREGTENGRYTEADADRYLPYPVFIVLEEAHRFAPVGEAKSKGIIKRLLAEGRKFGIGVCMVSQRPSKLDPDALSQCMTQVTMRVINPGDQKQISQSLESISRDLIEELPALSKGQAIISGIGINTAATVKIRMRYTSDLKGRTKDAPAIWLSHMSEKVDVSTHKDIDVGV